MITFAYYRQPPWAPRSKGGRIPRKLKKRLPWHWRLHYIALDKAVLGSDVVQVEQWGETITIWDSTCL